MKLGERLLTQSKILVIAVSLSVVLIIAWLDSITRWDLSFFIFYSVPIFVVAWTCPRALAIGFAVFCAGLSALVNLYQVPDLSMHAWRSLNRLASFSFVAIAGSALRSQREYFLGRLAALERARELEHETVRVSEREHRKIGQDLHDSVCQSLAAIDFAIGLLRKRLDPKAPEEAQKADEIQQLLRKTLVETRSLARGIFPVQLEKDGLAVALEELVASTKMFHQVGISIESQGEIAISDTEVAMHLYRIAQEALSNALRHSYATAIKITLRQEGSDFAMEIGDNGCGIRQHETSSKGMGLLTIRYRSQLINAALNIKDQAAGGTLVQCSLHLSNGHHA